MKTLLKYLEYILFWDIFETKTLIQQAIKDERKTTDLVYITSFRFDFSHKGEGYGFVVVYCLGLMDNEIGKFVVKR